MRLIRLNLSALRARRLPRLLPPEIGAAEFFDSPQTLTMSRRGLLGWAGAAAMALTLPSAADACPFQFVGGRKRVAFRVGGREQWTIDTRHFAGNPQLTASERKDSIRIELKDARYPGTEIPADLLCELRRGAAGWQMHLRLGWGGFESRTPFVSWLASVVPARSRVRVDGRVCGLGSSASLVGAGEAQAEFFPNWTWHLRGPGVANLLGVGGGASSDSLAVSLLSPGEASLFTRPPEKRTLLALQRRELGWPLGPDFSDQQAWDLVRSDGSFDLIHIEAGESASGEPCGALLAESRGEGPSFWFVPGENITGDDGAAFRLGLRNARYVLIFEGGRRESAFVADYDPAPAWLYAGGRGFEIGGGAEVEPFELTMPRGEATQVRCAPALRRIAAPLSGAIAEPGTVQAGTQLAFAFGPAGAQVRILKPTLPRPLLPQ